MQVCSIMYKLINQMFVVCRFLVSGTLINEWFFEFMFLVSSVHRLIKDSWYISLSYQVTLTNNMLRSMQISGIKCMLIKFKYVVCRFLVYTWKLNVHGVQVSSIMYTFMQ